VAVIVAGGILFAVNRKISSIFYDYRLLELMNMSHIVEKEINDISLKLKKQLTDFSAMVSDDRDFVIKLLVEKDFTAPEVADIAIQHMKSMGFSFLEVVDSEFKILSSGHFPASTGNTAVKKKDMSDNTLTFIYDNVKGTEVLSLQVKIPFSCSDITLYCIGGIAVDSDFISEIKPCEEIQILLRQDNSIIGMENIETISDIENNKIIINDKAWMVNSMSLKGVEGGKKPEIFILMEKPEKMSLLDMI
jgi:hypothetical protein